MTHKHRMNNVITFIVTVIVLATAVVGNEAHDLIGSKEECVSAKAGTDVHSGANRGICAKLPNPREHR